MKYLLVLASALSLTAGCRAQPPATPEPEVVTPAGATAPAEVATPTAPEVAVIPKVDDPAELAGPPEPEVELYEVKGLAWIGDADVNLHPPFMKRFSLSGFWRANAAGRATFTTAGYELRHGAATGPSGHFIVDETDTGLRMKLYRGDTFTGKDEAFEMPIDGALGKFSVEMALDRLALLTWDAPKPRLTVFRQGSKKPLWSKELDVASHVDGMVVAWYPDGALSVEWRSVDNYQRLIIDARNGSVLSREQLDPAITKAILDPIRFMQSIEVAPKDAPAPISSTAPFVAVVSRRPEVVAQLCPGNPHQLTIARAVEVRPGLVLAVGALYDERGDSSPPVVLNGGQCPAVVVIDGATGQTRGRWARPVAP